jgi:hypothetical protein
VRLPPGGKRVVPGETKQRLPLTNWLNQKWILQVFFVSDSSPLIERPKEADDLVPLDQCPLVLMAFREQARQLAPNVCDSR